MKKVVLKNLFVVLAMLSISLGFVACNDDDKGEDVVSLAGKWAYIADSYRELIIIDANNSVVSTGQNGSDFWLNIKGKITIKGDELTYDGEDGRHFTGTFQLKGNTLVINENGKEKAYEKLIENFSMEGDWKVSKIIPFIKAVKDEVKLPVGSVNGETIPTTVQTSNFSGQFVNWAVLQYFGNPKFVNNSEMQYTVVKEKKDTLMSKNCQISNNMITVSGKVGSLDINNSFMIFQSLDGKYAYLFLTKENVANMFMGYGLMLSEGNVSDGDNESLKDFKESFMEAFGNYAIIITMTKQ